MAGDDFEPRLGKIGMGSKEPRYLGSVLKAATLAGAKTARAGRKFNGSRIGRGASIARVIGSGDPQAAFRARRVIVKTRLVKFAGKGLSGAKAHLRYIQRDGVTRDGEPGELYSADRDVADGRDFLARSGEDRHQFRFIVSPEDGDQYQDLKPYVRRLMTQMEKDLGTRLEWVAVDHYNTGHPHSHIMLRGKDDMGKDLVIAPEYISHGLRERASRIATLDLGPRTDLEIQERQRFDIGAERFTAIDRQLLEAMDGERMVGASDGDPFRQSLKAGRLQTLARMGLAEPEGAGAWRLADDLEETLRRIGERGDIIRTMQRELSSHDIERPVADRIIYEPSVPDAQPIVGRVVMRGLADEYRDTHYLMIDGVDGRTHYVAIGRGDGHDPLASEAVVRVEPYVAKIREVDRTIAAVAQASYGKYSREAHQLFDPRASEEFISTHVRRLEAMRRLMREPARDELGTWTISADHLDRVAAYEARHLRDRPVAIEVLSSVPIERLPSAEGATWLDRELVSGSPTPLREAGFGKEVASAQAVRRQWLIAEQLAREEAGQVVYRSGMLTELRRREVLARGTTLSRELGLPFAEASPGERIEGRFARRIDLNSGRYALIERSRDFTLVPWRPVLERQIGKEVSGIMRDDGPSWSFGRRRSGPTIT